MVALRELFILFEKFGLINLHRFDLARQDTLQTFYVTVATCLFVFHILCHLFSTLTRAIRYLPEFFQTFLEDCIIFFLIFSVYFFRTKNQQINELIDLTEHFSTADKKILKNCKNKSTQTCVFFISTVFIALSGGFLETALPITGSELQIRHHVYRTAHPERRLPYNLRVPFIDETETPYYEVLYGLDVAIMFYFAFWVGLSVSVLPVLTIHVRGQYEILAKYIAKIGQLHHDSRGYRIFYSNIEKDEYIIKMYSPVVLRNKLLHLTEKIKRQRKYERDYVRQIVKFHIKLIVFREKLITMISPIIYGLVFANNIMISLCLYQIVVGSDQISALRLFKFIAEFIAIGMEYFIICSASEMVDDCHGLLLSALAKSSWERCSNRTKQDLCMLLRRVQKPNHLRFYDGAVVINAPFFLHVVKVAYTFVNFMGLRELSNVETSGN